MEESIVITIAEEGAETEYTLKYFNYGYTHRFSTFVNQYEIFFEPDDEGNYRAIVSGTMQPGVKEREVISALLHEIQTHFKG